MCLNYYIINDNRYVYMYKHGLIYFVCIIYILYIMLFTYYMYALFLSCIFFYYVYSSSVPEKA